ncbi:MAG: hypothetical protein U9Q37_03380 [Euryarchaeota archaeon]|nr:hypothetical protein [Euryarchaeota archaeon]
MKISGTILNAKNNTPVVSAKIKLVVQGNEIAAVVSDEHGRYDYSTDEDYIGQTIAYVIKKDHFEEKTFSSVIDKTEYQKKFLLREHEVIEDKKAKAKNIIIGISIFTVLILLFLATQPQLTVSSVQAQNGSLSLNSERDYTYSIDRAWPWNLPIIKHIGKLKWELLEDKDWIYLHDATGEGSQNVVITLYTPDSEFSPNPGEPYHANILIDNTGSILWKNRLLTIPFDISNKKDKHPEMSVNLRLSPNPGSINKEEPDTFKPVEIEIDNSGTGTLFWAVRSNVSWITLMVDEDKPKPGIGKVRFIDCLGTGLEPKFGINFDQLDQELNKSRTNSATGRITVRANNDCKMKLYITATKKESGYEILHSRTELWNKTEVIYEYAKPDVTPENVAGAAVNNSTAS